MSRPRDYPVMVVIPTYNRAHLVPHAIESVLAQTVADQCGIVVVDDGSVDDTRHVVARYGDRVQYVYKSNGGLAAARNTGIEATRSELITFLDDDDEFVADKVERQLAAFARWPEVVLVAGRCAVRYENQPDFVRPAPDIPLDTPTDLAPILFERSLISVPAVMVRRDAIESAELFDGSLRRCEDYHMWVRLACRGPCVFLDAHLATFAADTPDALTRNRLAMFETEFRVRHALRAELRRRPDCRSAWRRGLARSFAAARDWAYRERLYRLALHYGVRSLMTQPTGRDGWEWTRLAVAAKAALWPPTASSRPPATTDTV